MDAVAFTPAQPVNALGLCPQRTTGRYVRTRITMPAGQSWTNLMGCALDAAPCGDR
ncbi:MAG: hypothetical protein WDO24_23330 [Pseudomonadota bacterium]